MILSVLPGRKFDISAHLFPIYICFSNSYLYSYFDKESFYTFGSKLFLHLSLHCFPVLPLILYTKDNYFDM